MSKKSKTQHKPQTRSKHSSPQKRRPLSHSDAPHAPVPIILDPAPILLSESNSSVYFAPVPEDPRPHRENPKLIWLLTILVPGFGHWLMHSKHALSYLLLTLLVWFLTVSALLAFAFQGFAWLFLLLPIAYHLAVLHDARVEYEGQEFMRWLHVLF